MSNALDEVASIAADLHGLLEWEALLGSDFLPRERVDRTPGAPIRSTEGSAGRSQSKPPSPRVKPSPQVSSFSPPQDPVPVEAKKPPPPRPKIPVPPPKPPKGGQGLSAKWAKLASAPTTHLVYGPVGSALMVVRAGGSSPEAEAMLERMLTNVLELERTAIAMVDLVRDTRTPQEIGEGFRSILPEFRPQQVLVMGKFALNAVFGESASLTEARGDWHTLRWEGGEAPMRVTHHPEAILALAARGQTGPKREAFADLKAVSARLS